MPTPRPHSPPKAGWGGGQTDSTMMRGSGTPWGSRPPARRKPARRKPRASSRRALWPGCRAGSSRGDEGGLRGHRLRGQREEEAPHDALPPPFCPLPQSREGADR